MPKTNKKHHKPEESKTPDPVLYKSLGFNQVDISENTSFLKPSEDIAKSLDGKIKKLKEKVRNDMKKFIKKKIAKPEKLESKFLTQQELHDLKFEFEKPTSERNYENMIILTEKLVFFSKFTSDIKKKIFEIGELKCFLPGEGIFYQGEVGENMYVILKGGVSIQKEGNEFGKGDVVVNSIYDGKQFGELALLNSLHPESSNNERTASCIACEKTYVLCMPKLNYSEILLVSNKKDLDEKIEFLMKLTLFNGIEKNFLIALATNIERICYNINETILEKGEKSKGLYIISKGYVDLFTEGYVVKKKYLEDYSPARLQRPKPDPMYFSLSPPPKPRKTEFFDSKSPKFSKEQKDLTDFDSNQLKKIKTFVTKNDLDSLSKGNLLVKEKLAFASLKEFDYFGGRALLEGFYGQNVENQPSKFAVIAQNSNTELYLLTKYHLQFLTQEMVVQLFTILEKSYEVDCPPDIDPKAMDSLFKDWQNYKKQLFQEIRKENFMNKHKHSFLLKK